MDGALFWGTHIASIFIVERFFKLFLVFCLAFAWPSSSELRADDQIYWSLNPSVLVARVINQWSLNSPRRELDLSSPPFYRLNRIASPGADLTVTGLLARLMIGAQFIADESVMANIAPLSLESVKVHPEFSHLPEEHRNLLIWILEQPDGSIKPQDLLTKSLEITHGKVLHALMLGWDVLCGGWREHASKHNVEHIRELFPKTQKLGFMPHTNGNKFAGWYHFWGVMTYSFYLTSQSRGIPTLSESLSMLWVGLEESLGFVTFHFPLDEAIHRAEHDFSGARTGYVLYRELKKWNRQQNEYLSNVNSEDSLFVKQKMPIKAPLRAIRNSTAMRAVSRFCSKLISELDKSR